MRSTSRAIARRVVGRASPAELAARSTQLPTSSRPENEASAPSSAAHAVSARAQAPSARKARRARIRGTVAGSRLVQVTVTSDPKTGERIVADAKEFVLYSWSVQDAISPIAVAGAEGRYFWDYDGKRYLDFASQLVNVSIGHQHPRVVEAIREQADRLATIGPGMATEAKSRLARLLAEVTPG